MLMLCFNLALNSSVDLLAPTVEGYMHKMGITLYSWLWSYSFLDLFAHYNHPNYE